MFEGKPQGSILPHPKLWVPKVLGEFWVPPLKKNTQSFSRTRNLNCFLQNHHKSYAPVINKAPVGYPKLTQSFGSVLGTPPKYPKLSPDPKYKIPPCPSQFAMRGTPASLPWGYPSQLAMGGTVESPKKNLTKSLIKESGWPDSSRRPNDAKDTK